METFWEIIITILAAIGLGVGWIVTIVAISILASLIKTSSPVHAKKPIYNGQLCYVCRERKGKMNFAGYDETLGECWSHPACQRGVDRLTKLSRRRSRRRRGMGKKFNFLDIFAIAAFITILILVMTLGL
jgi:hypothetical protein